MVVACISYVIQRITSHQLEGYSTFPLVPNFYVEIYTAPSWKKHDIRLLVQSWRGLVGLPFESDAIFVSCISGWKLEQPRRLNLLSTQMVRGQSFPNVLLACRGCKQSKTTGSSGIRSSSTALPFLSKFRPHQERRLSEESGSECERRYFTELIQAIRWNCSSLALASR